MSPATTTTNSMFQKSEFGYDNNLSSTYLMNDNYNSSSIFGSNVTTAASVHHTDEHSKVDNLFGKLSSAASALKSTVQKQLPHPTLTPTTIATTSTGFGVTSIATSSTTANSFLQNNKLPPIPTITNSVYGMDSLTTTTGNNFQTLETRSTNENDDSMFSRFNSYESESVPYSTSNDLSMYTIGQDVIPEYDNNGDLYGETDLGYDYGGNDIGGTVKQDLDGFGDSFYNQQSSTTTMTHNTTSRLGISDNNYTLSTASTTVPKTLPPIPDSASIYDTQNSNLYDYASDNSYMNPIITTAAAITTTAATISSTIGTNDITNYDGTLDTMSHDYPYEEQYDNQNIISSNVTRTVTPGLNPMTDSAYTSDYYDNCQYDYEYTENETDYLASGDIIEKGKQPSSTLYQNNNNNNNYTASTALNTSTNYTMTTGVTGSYQQQQPQQPSRPSLEQAKQQEPNKTASILGQSKSLLGGLSNMIGSSVTNLISKSSELTKPAGSTATATTPSNTSSLGFGSASAFGGMSNQYNNTTISTTTSSSLFGTSTAATTASSNLLSNTFGYDQTMNNMTTSATATTTVDSMMNSTVTDYSNSLYNDTTGGMLIDNVHGLMDHQQPEILEPYREDFEDEFHNRSEMVDNQHNLDDAYTNGYYDENQVRTSS